MAPVFTASVRRVYEGGNKILRENECPHEIVICNVAVFNMQSEQGGLCVEAADQGVLYGCVDTVRNHP
jgi:hypothetical protein